jgi:TolA-binding protein
MATVSQMTHDPALETSIFWDQYKVPIIGAIVALLLGAIGYAGYLFYTQQRDAEAAALLAAASSPQDYQQVVDRYASSAAAASAYLLLAEAQRAKRNFAEANVTLHKFIDQFPKHELIATAWMGVAANLDSLGKSDEALSTYQRLVAEYPQNFNAPLALLSQVPLLKAKNRMEDARHVCETLLTQYRESVLINEALRELQTIPKAAPKPASAKP